MKISYRKVNCKKYKIISAFLEILQFAQFTQQDRQGKFQIKAAVFSIHAEHFSDFGKAVPNGVFVLKQGFGGALDTAVVFHVAPGGDKQVCPVFFVVFLNGRQKVCTVAAGPGAFRGGQQQTIDAGLAKKANVFWGELPQTEGPQSFPKRLVQTADPGTAGPRRAGREAGGAAEIDVYKRQLKRRPRGERGRLLSAMR